MSTSSKLIKYIEDTQKVNSDYSIYFVRHLNKSIFNKDILEMSSISTALDEEKIHNKNYTQLKSKLKKILVSKDIKIFIDKLNESLYNVNIPSENNNILLLQIFKFINLIYTQKDETLDLIISDFGNNIYNFLPKICNSNNLTNITTQNVENFKKNIFQDIYNIFWQTNYEDKLKFFNFIKCYQNDIFYIKIISEINEFINQNGRTKQNNLAKYIYSYFSCLNTYDLNETNNTLSNQFNQNKDIRMMINEYFRVKQTEKYNLIVKITNFYNKIKPNFEDNKYLILIYLELKINEIKNNLDMEQFILFNKIFYQDLEEYWVNNIETPIYFDSDSNYLYDFRTWNFKNSNFIDLIDIIEKNEIQVQKTLKTVEKKKKKRIKKYF